MDESLLLWITKEGWDAHMLKPLMLYTQERQTIAAHIVVPTLPTEVQIGKIGSEF
ncbi:hypothetical protein SDC9_103809 [bioreactor metagenome]|uniref:Uncharacterized protein n=1 Tax=bioreactor metagenome TaxID=1076179 RepID=A0A645AUS1_9ZZZZ